MFSNKKLSILLNPAAGGGRAAKMIPRLKDLLNARGCRHEILVSQSEKHLRRLAREQGAGDGQIMVVGGDSSFTIVAREILSSGLDPLLAFLPAGTCNDLAREFSFASAEKLLAALAEDRYRRIDVGKLYFPNKAEQFFIGSVSLGFGALFNPILAGMKARFRPLSRLTLLNRFLAGLETLNHPDLPLEVFVKTDRDEFRGKILSGLIANISYYACGLRALPGAGPADGILDALFIEPMSKTSFIKLLLRISRGLPQPVPGTKRLSSTAFAISSPQPFAIQADGDLLPEPDAPEYFNQVELICVPEGLRLANGA